MRFEGSPDTEDEEGVQGGQEVSLMGLLRILCNPTIHISQLQLLTAKKCGISSHCTSREGLLFLFLLFSSACLTPTVG